MKRYTLLLIALLVFDSCTSFIDIEPSPNQIPTQNIFMDELTAASAVTGVYSEMRGGNQAFANGALSVFGGLSAGEINNTANNSTYTVFYKNSLLPDNSTVSGVFWQQPYQLIYRTNLILEGLEVTTSLKSSLQKQLKGEMLVVRSFCYFYLINLFGDVPLILNTNYKENAVVARTPVSLIYQQIIKDLQFAGENLAVDYPSAGKVRPNRYTAKALLSRVFLYDEQWGNAEKISREIIETSYYKLNDLHDVFRINSPETIWEISSRNDATNSAEALSFIPSSKNVIPSFVLSNELIDNFEINDLRNQHWIDRNIIGNKEYYYPYKYKNRLNVPVTEYNIVFRLAEQYLIGAESMAHQGDLLNAIETLNVIRKRAGLTPLDNTLNKSEILNAIEIERYKEFFAEWGHRWFDLKRTNRAATAVYEEKGRWENWFSYYPIPSSELKYNSKLIQNEGYDN